MAALKRVAIVFTGGTISMLVDPTAGGAVPTLSGAEILARTPGLNEIADVVPVDRGLVPASHFTFPALLDLAATIRGLLDDGSIDGVVLVQGTDTIEETSFLLDLVLDSPKPLIVTGAMRNAGDPDYEGPANLLDAVGCAASELLTGYGVAVVLGGTIEPADDVLKVHTSSLTAFQSPNLGRVGRIDEGRVVLERGRRPRRRPLAVEHAAEPIPIITATVAMDAAILDAAATLEPAAIVVAATGAGNTSADLLAAAVRAMAAGIPVVLTSRCPAGAASTAYAFPGGGATWVRAGALLAGTLTAPKARIALAIGLGAGLDRPALAAHLVGPVPAPADPEVEFSARPGGRSGG